MKKTLKIKEICLVAIALFGLFFGAGNLIFPIQAGALAGENALLVAIGLNISAVIIPIVGVIAFVLVKCENLLELSSKAGKGYGLFFTTLLYLSIGPLFAIPRNATTTFSSGFNVLFGESTLSLFTFTFFFFVIILYLSLKPNKIVDYVGKWIMPVFLSFIFILFVVYIFNPIGDFGKPSDIYINNPLIVGLFEGYNTMDGLASLAFGIVVVTSIKNYGITDDKTIFNTTIKAGLICSLFFFAIYFFLTFLGASSSVKLGLFENGALALTSIITYYFGEFGIYVNAILFLTACFSTALGLVVACSKTFNHLFPQLSYKTYVYLIVLVSFLIANTGLNNILEISIPLLMFLYPITIAYIILCVLNKVFNNHNIVFKATIYCVTFIAFFDLCKYLPSYLQNPLSLKLVSFASKYIPLYNLGFGWVSFFILGFIIGVINLIIYKRKNLD